MKRQLFIVLAGLAILVASIMAMGTLSGMKEAPEKAEKPVIKKYVKTSPVEYNNVKTEITAFGRVRTAQSLDMIAEVSGRMIEGSVKLKEGQSFRKGQLLFKVDDEEARLNLQSQKSNFMRDVAGILPDMKVDYADNAKAWEIYFKSINLKKDLPELPDHKSDKEKTFLATKNIYSNYYSIKSQEARLKKHSFYAPFSGNIYSVNLQSGSYVNPGANIAKLIRSDKLELKVDVDAREINWIKLGSTANIYSDEGIAWSATVTRIGEFVNQNTQSIDVFLTINQNENRLFDGQFLRAVMPSRIIQGSMIVPRNVVFNGDEVFIVKDTVLNVRKVDIHKINQETIVFSGLEEGSDLVIEPLINAFNGMPVTKLENADTDIDTEVKEPRENQALKGQN